MFSKQAFKKSSSHLRQIGTLNHSDLDYNYRDISSSSSALMDIFLFLLFSPSFCQCCLTVRCIERFSLILLQTFRVEIRLKSICLGKTGTFEPRTKITRTKNHKRKWWKEALQFVPPFAGKAGAKTGTSVTVLSKEKTHCFLSRHVTFTGGRKKNK